MKLGSPKASGYRGTEVRVVAPLGIPGNISSEQAEKLNTCNTNRVQGLGYRA